MYGISASMMIAPEQALGVEITAEFFFLRGAGEGSLHLAAASLLRFARVM